MEEIIPERIDSAWEGEQCSESVSLGIGYYGCGGSVVNKVFKQWCLKKLIQMNSTSQQINAAFSNKHEGDMRNSSEKYSEI